MPECKTITDANKQQLNWEKKEKTCQSACQSYNTGDRLYL